jgi:hypothetical protein
MLLQVRMHKKIIEMVWELTIPADTDPSLVQDGALAAVISHYMSHMPVGLVSQVAPDEVQSYRAGSAPPSS